MRLRKLVGAEIAQRELRRANAVGALQDLIAGRQALADQAAAAKAALKELDDTIRRHRDTIVECTEHLELGAPDDGQQRLPGIPERPTVTLTSAPAPADKDEEQDEPPAPKRRRWGGL